MNTSGKAKKVHELLGRIGLYAAVNLVVSGLIMGGTLVWFESRLANSQERANEIVYLQQQIDGSQNKIVEKFGVYANDSLETKVIDSDKRQDVVNAIVEAELQVLRLKDRVPAGKATLATYDKQLATFLNVVRGGKSWQDLGGTYPVFRQLLATHRALDSELAEQKAVSILY